MWSADGWKEYELLDCGGGERLERWGEHILVRPDPQAIWDRGGHPLWKKPDAVYHRSDKGGGQWEIFHLPESWHIHYKDLTFQIKPMSFKHTGVFPEQAANWDFIRRQVAERKKKKPVNVLNLFAYTGGATLAAASAGASVCHVDASKGMVAWARENARLSGLGEAPIRYIVDDCKKFIQREVRRGRKYDAIIMDPPSYGRGPSGEIWKFEESIAPFLQLYGSAHRRSLVCHHQFLYHRHFPFGARLSVGHDHGPPLRWGSGGRRTAAAGEPGRPGPALRPYQPLDCPVRPDKEDFFQWNRSFR